MAKSAAKIYLNEAKNENLVRTFGGNEREVKLLALSYLDATKEEFLSLHPCFSEKVGEDFTIIVQYEKKNKHSVNQKVFSSKTITVDEKVWLVGERLFGEFIRSIKERTVDFKSPKAMYSVKSKEYNVAFWVEGYIESPDDDIGEVECNGVRMNNDGSYSINDGRIYFSITAHGPKEAYEEAKKLFQDASFGKMEVNNWGLEHVVDDETDTWFYQEDL